MDVVVERCAGLDVHRDNVAKARLRSKVPQLREALANRFQVDHHGILVAQLLAHIDTLDQAIARATLVSQSQTRRMIAGRR
jgi:hypothetical protein